MIVIAGNDRSYRWAETCWLGRPVPARRSKLTTASGRLSGADGASGDDAFEQRARLLGGIAEAFGGACMKGRQIIPYIGHRNTGTLVETYLLAQPGVVLGRKEEPILLVELPHHVQRDLPAVLVRSIETAIARQIVVAEVGSHRRIGQIAAPEPAPIRVPMDEMLGNIVCAVGTIGLVPDRGYAVQGAGKALTTPEWRNRRRWRSGMDIPISTPLASPKERR